MKHYLKMIKPFDVIIVVLLLIGSFIPYFIFAHQEASRQAAQPTSSQAAYTAVVTHDGKEVYRIKLTGHKGTTTWKYNDGHDWNTIVTTGNKIQIKDANCSDQVCVRKGKISKPGQTIVCLPHKLLVEIKSTGHTSGNNTGGMVTE